MTNVETTSGAVDDGEVTPKIHGALQQRGLVLGTHIVDTGFLDAELLVESRDVLRVGTSMAWTCWGQCLPTITGKLAKAPALRPNH
jgi:hypothetical protein